MTSPNLPIAEFDDEVPAEAAEATRAGAVLRNGLWSTLGTLLPQAYTLAGSIIVARFLGAEGVGRVSFIALVEATLVLLFGQGLPRSLMRYTSEVLGRGRDGDARDLTIWFTKIGVAGAGVCGGVMVVAGLAGSTPRWAWVFAGIAGAAMVLQSFPNAYLLGTQRWDAATLAGLLPASAGIVLKVIFLLAGGGVTSLFLVDAAMATITLVATSALAARGLRRVPRLEVADRALRASALRFGLISSLGIVVTFVVWRRTEVFFLEHYSTDTEVALYSVPFSAVSALLLVPQAASAVLAPAFATLYGAGARERIASGFARSMRFITLLTTLLTAITIACGPELLRLVYGGAFRGSGRLLVVLTLPFPLVALMYTCLSILLGLRRQWVPIASDAAAAVVNLGLDAVLIPGHGAMGAALANACSQAVGTIPILVYTTWLIGGRVWTIRGTAGPAIVTAVAAVVGWISVASVGGLGGLVVGLVVTPVVWLLLAAVLRVLRGEDATWLQATIGPPLRRQFAR